MYVWCVSLQVVAEQIPQLVQGVRGSHSQPDSPSAQLALISASQNFLQVSDHDDEYVTHLLSSKGCNSSYSLSVFKSNPELRVCPLLPQPGAKMVTASKATVPTISDQASAMQLSQCAKNLASALAELRTASQKVRLLYGLDDEDLASIRDRDTVTR